MHPNVISEEPGRCAECGMKLLPIEAPTNYVCPMHPHVTSESPDRCPECGMKLLPAHLVDTTSEHAEHDMHALGQIRRRKDAGHAEPAHPHSR